MVSRLMRVLQPSSVLPIALMALFFTPLANLHADTGGGASGGGGEPGDACEASQGGEFSYAPPPFVTDPSTPMVGSWSGSMATPDVPAPTIFTGSATQVGQNACLLSDNNGFTGPEVTLAEFQAIRGRDIVDTQECLRAGQEVIVQVGSNPAGVCPNVGFFEIIAAGGPKFIGPKTFSVRAVIMPVQQQ